MASSAQSIRGVTVNVVRGNLQLNADPGDTTINVTGSALGGELQLRAGSNGLAGPGNFTGTTINVNSPGQAVGVFAEEVATGAALVNTIGTPLNFTGPVNNIVSDRIGTDQVVNGQVVLTTVNTVGNLDLHTRTNTPITINALNVTGPAGISNNAPTTVQTLNGRQPADDFRRAGACRQW